MANKHHLPLEKENIRYVIKDSPGHKIYKEGAIVYDLTKAIDFLCKEGTSINATLEGKVVAVFNKVTKNWNKEEEPPIEHMKEEEQNGNYVVIEHNNRELSIHSHLKKDSIIVKEGEDVKTRQKIGLSGNTGWSIEPHLHYMIHDFPEENNGGYRSLAPNWEKGIESVIQNKLISHKEYQKFKNGK